ncbi:MAG: protein-export chaperone SecB, partial [Methylotenera sp.]
GFLPVLLNPINFEALYAQQKQQAEAAAATATH